MHSSGTKSAYVVKLNENPAHKRGKCPVEETDEKNSVTKLRRMKQIIKFYELYKLAKFDIFLR